MKAKKAGKARAKAPFVDSETFRHLPYRPTRRLRRTAAPTHSGYGWKYAQFRDDLGNLYERARDGEWERWSLVLEQTGARKRVLFKHKPEKKPRDFDDALDRHDDLIFTTMALDGLVSDAEERNVFGPIKLDNLHSAIRRFYSAIDELRQHMEMLKPPKPEVH